MISFSSLPNLKISWDREKRWRYAFRLVSWLCLLAAFGYLWHVTKGRLYYLLDSDMSSELVLANLLAKERTFLTPNFFYSTEPRVLNLNVIFTPLFWVCDNWLKVREIGTLALYLLLLLSCWYFCRQAGIGILFPAIGAVLLVPFSEVYFRIALLTAAYLPNSIITFFSLGMIFHFLRLPKGRMRWFLLGGLCLLAALSSMNGPRLILHLYLPLALVAALLCLLRAEGRPGDTLPGFLPRDRALLLVSGAALAAGAAGHWFNKNVLAAQFHFVGQDGIKYQPFTLERLELLLNGWLETFGYRTGTYLGGGDLLANALCFLSLLVVLCAVGALFRRWHTQSYTQQVMGLLFVLSFAIYIGLYLFTDMVYYTRYNIALTLYIVPVAVLYLYSLPRSRLIRAAAFGTLGLLMAVCVRRFYTETWKLDLTHHHTEAVTALRVAGYLDGYATFWNANLMVELSNGAFAIRVWDPAQDLHDVETLYEWLQPTAYFEEDPEGPVFAFLSLAEAAPLSLEEGEVVYEDDLYVAYGYPSFAAMKADFAD